MASQYLRRYSLLKLGNASNRRLLFSSLAHAPAEFEPQHKKAVKIISTLKPQSLSLPHESRFYVAEPTSIGLKGFALRLLGYYAKESKLIRGARTLYSRIKRQVDNPVLYETFGLEKSFRTTHAMLVLHMWMCLARMKTEGKDATTFGQFLYEMFNSDVEQRVAAAGVKMLLNKWMKELEKMFYGAVIAYDKAMKPEASRDELPQAIWRNIFAEDQSPMPSGEKLIPVQDLARYVRQETASMAMTDIDAIMSGNILFSIDSKLETESTNG